MERESKVWIECYDEMCANWRHPISQPQRALWWKTELHKWTPDDIATAVDDVLRECPAFPSLAQIVERRPKHFKRADDWEKPDPDYKSALESAGANGAYITPVIAETLQRMTRADVEHTIARQFVTYQNGDEMAEDQYTVAAAHVLSMFDRGNAMVCASVAEWFLEHQQRIANDGKQKAYQPF